MDEFFKKILSADDKEYRSIPFWSWNDELEEDELREQIRWMKSQGFGGYFMHARGGLTTEYLGDKWFKCVEACIDEGKKQNLDSWAYDENGWPSGFAGGKLLEDENNRDRYLTFTEGDLDKKALVSYYYDGDKLVRTTEAGKGVYLNVFEHIAASTADILNYEVVEKFIKETHEKYKENIGKQFNKLLKGFFTDEPQYYRWAHAYTRILPDFYKKTYGEDLLDGLGLMFVEKEGYRKFRYRYWKCMQTLMLKNFAEHIYNWCSENGVEFTGHYVEECNLTWQMACNAGIMPFYEFEHMPGMDKLARILESPVPPRQVSSVARQLGKKRVLSEMFACCGWDVTPSELKRLADWQYVNGVNVMCQHLLPYSEWGQRKRDYPAHFSWANPWVRHDFKTFNDYYAKLGYLLGESEEIVNVGVFQPIRSAYLDYKEYTSGSVAAFDDSYVGLCEKLSAMNIPYHILDETIMARHGKTDGGKLVVGNYSYDAVIFPKTTNMDKETKELFEKFVSNGGKVLFTDGAPEYLEGEKYSYSFKSNITLEEIASAQLYSIDKKDTKIQSTLRVYNGRPFIYAVNLDEDNSYTVEFGGNFKGFVSLDIEKGTTEKLSRKLRFEPGQSYVLFLTDEETQYSPEKETFSLGGEFNVVDCSDNYLTLDSLKYSFDGVNYSDKMHYMGVFNEMLDKRYDGDLYLKYEFEVENVTEKIKFVSENMNNIEMKVNGKEISFDGVSDFDKKTYTAFIADKVVKGKNEAVIKIHFFEDEKVYYALFGENVTESLKNCLAYNTTIEACYLQGDFGVFSKGGFRKGKEPNVLIAEDDFYISEKRKTVCDTVSEGFPFFAGNITLEKKINYNGGATVLDLKGRFHLADVTVNGVKVDKRYFDKKVDLKDYLKNGENTIRVTLYSSNRNLLGPHHYLHEEEPLSVGPDTFELIGTWKNGVSNAERKDYSFVKFGLFE